MGRKSLYIAAVLLMVFASANATSHTTKSSIHVEYIPQPNGNGDYLLYIFASDRMLVCEEKAVKIVDQGDAIHPIILECKH